jgi:hypothetical protein
MQTRNDTTKPADSPEQEAGEGCSGATCSASSETPKTEALIKEWENLIGGEDIIREWVEVILLESHADMERKRNAAWQTLGEIRQLFVDDESFGAIVEALFSKPLEEAEAQIARLNSLLNVQTLPTEGAAKKP